MRRWSKKARSSVIETSFTYVLNFYLEIVEPGNLQRNYYVFLEST